MTKNTKLIHVTKADINAGRPRDECYCPVAVALKRQCPSRRHWSVGKDIIVADGSKIMDTPESVKLFIVVCDGRGPAKPRGPGKPFSFRIPLTKNPTKP